MLRSCVAYLSVFALLIVFVPVHSAHAFDISCSNGALSARATGPDSLEVGQAGSFYVHSQYLNSPVYRLDGWIEFNDGSGRGLYGSTQASPWYTDAYGDYSFSSAGTYTINFWGSMQDGGAGIMCGQGNAAQVVVTNPPQPLGTICAASNVSTSWILSGPSGNYQYTGTSGCRDDWAGTWSIGSIPSLSGYTGPSLSPSQTSQTVGNGGAISWNISYTANPTYGTPSYGTPPYTTPPSGTACNTAYPSNAFYGCYFDGTTAPTSGAPVALSQGIDATVASPVGAATAINFDWGNGNVGSSGKADSVSVVWRGAVNFQNGTYVFHTVSDDGVELIVDGVQMISNWTDHGPTQNDSAARVLSGVRNVALRYYENGGGATAKLWWDFTPAPVYTVSGYVYRDFNSTTCCSGVKDAGEPGISGRTVTLTDATSGATISTATTDGNGYYSMASIPAGSYRITHAIPSGYVRTTDDSSPLSVSGNATYNFGLYLPPPAEPGSQTNSCSADGTQATLSWAPVSGASNYLLRVAPSPNGVAANCGANLCSDYYSGTSYVANVTPGQSYQWWVHSNTCSNYTLSTSCYSTATTHTFTCTANAINFTVSISQPTGGTVVSSDSNLNCGATCSRTYTSNSSVLLTATPRSSYWQFNGWGGDCASFGKATSCSLRVNSAKSVTASFILRAFRYLEF